MGVFGLPDCLIASAVGAVSGVSTMIGPLAGGYLVEHFLWRWAFFINLPLGLLAAAVLVSQLPRVKPEQRGRMDSVGALLLSAGLVNSLLSTNRQPLAGISISTYTFASMCEALIKVFVWLHSRMAHPLLPLSLFAKREFSAVSLLSARTSFMLFSEVVFMPMYFQSAHGLSPADAGLHLMPRMAGITTASIVCGRGLAATGRVRRTALAACLLVAAAFALLGWWVREPGLSMRLLSSARCFRCSRWRHKNSAPMPLMGVATASPAMFRSVAGAVGVSVLATLFASAMATGFKSGMAAQDMFGLAMSTVLWTAAAVSAKAALVSCGLPRRLVRRAAAEAAHTVQPASNLRT